MNTVRMYLDFISPYTYLGLAQAERFSAQHDVEWDLRPVVYGVLLDRAGLVGPVETEAKRRYTFRDVTRAAELLGVPMIGPPAHPFRSLDALRLLVAYAEDPVGLPLACTLAAAAWGKGQDLTRPEVLTELAEEVGANRRPVVEILSDPEIKLTLRTNTEEAIGAGVFGVPTFEYAGELFWGHDRLSHLAARLTGRLGSASAQAAMMEDRPRGIDRSSAPAREREGSS